MYISSFLPSQVTGEKYFPSVLDLGWIKWNLMGGASNSIFDPMSSTSNINMYINRHAIISNDTA